MIMEKPKMEIVEFEAEDIITSSTCPLDDCSSVSCNFVGCDDDDNF